MQNVNEVSAGLREVAALLDFSGAPKFKVNAYEQAAEVVDTVGAEIGVLVEQSRLRELKGIGPASARQIEELWNSGSSELLTKLRSELPEGAGELVQIEGMTPRRVRSLHDALAVRSVADLRAACVAGRVGKVSGFGGKIEQRLLEACDRFLQRGPASAEPMILSHALELAANLQRELASVAPEVQLAGALRRGEETVSEIEFVVAGERASALHHLSGLRNVLRVDLAEGVAHLAEGIRVKVHGAAASSFGDALFLATGNDAHVSSVQALASGGLPACKTERELYGCLGLSFVPPELRTGGGELERAANGGFDDLVELEHVQGMVHCHTTHSDGKNSVVEMARAAHELGMKYITITDHSPSAHYARGVTLDRLKQQWDEIGEAEQQVPIRILRGTESDILADGSLDFPDSVLEQFDIVIASIHARHRMDRSAMTARLTRALSLPVFKIWGHALGRILNQRPPIDCDVLSVLDALAASRGAIEINADPHRLDLSPTWIPAARERKIPFVLSVDAHSTRGLGVLRYGVLMARRGGVERREVLNTRTAEDFAASVRPG